jgi:hypothetical protein
VLDLPKISTKSHIIKRNRPLRPSDAPRKVTTLLPCESLPERLLRPERNIRCDTMNMDLLGVAIDVLLVASAAWIIRIYQRKDKLRAPSTTQPVCKRKAKMKTNLITLTAVALISAGCATSPNAWRDLNDGQGMRGWAGIPLKDSVPLALAQGLKQTGNSMQQRHYATGIDPLAPGSPINPVYTQPMPTVQPMQIPPPTPWVPISTGH